MHKNSVDSALSVARLTHARASVRSRSRSIRRFRELLLGIARSGASVFMCTHILEMAEKLCGRVGIIYKGKLIAEGTVEELRRKSGSPEGHTLEDIFLSLTED